MQHILEHMASPTNQERLRTSLQYLGSDRGDPSLLKEISLFLRRHTLEDEVPHHSSATTTTTTTKSPMASCDLDMFLTHGVSHGLDMLCTTQTTPGDVVLIERPSYFLAAGIFRSHGLRIESLPMKRQESMDDETNIDTTAAGGGALMVDVDALEQGLKDGGINVPRMIYIVPTHQNPTANTMPTADRWKLCKLARRFGFLVAADEVYHLLDWREDKKQRPARFSVLDHILLSKQHSESSSSETDGDFCANNNNASNKRQRQQPVGCSVSVSSFTKIFSPGVRCGWIEGPTEIIDSIVDLGYIQSQGGCAPFVGNVLRTALEEGFQDQILERLNESYKMRCKILCNVLESEPGIRIRCRPNGGYFVWVDFLDLPEAETMQVDVDVGVEDGTDSPASVFARYCFERGLKFMPGMKCDSVFESFEQSGQPKELCQNSARLCFADMDADDVGDGARLLIELYREYTGKR
jgi:2-aminoadipate transaminase